MKAYNEITNYLEKLNIKYEITIHNNYYNSNDGKKDSEYYYAFKTLAFEYLGKLILICLYVKDRVDYNKLSSILKIERKYLKMASINDLHNIYGYEKGGISPIPFSKDMIVIVDKAILDYEYIYCGIGVPNKSLKIKVSNLIKILPIIVDIKKNKDL